LGHIDTIGQLARRPEGCVVRKLGRRKPSYLWRFRKSGQFAKQTTEMDDGGRL
jgi:hypothetical protein